MIVLRQPPAAWGLPSISPFCVKLETYLRMTKIEYQVKPGNILKAPRGRVPYIEFEGKRMGDSSLIIEFLKNRMGDQLDAGLSREQRAQGIALQRLVENHLYYSVAWLRWSQEGSWKYVRDYFTPLLPPFLGKLIIRMIRKGMMAGLRDQGIGEHSTEQIIDFAKTDLRALSDLLGEKKFFLGETPSSVDAVLYGFLIHLIWTPWGCPVKAYALSLKNLVSYCERMKNEFWT